MARARRCELEPHNRIPYRQSSHHEKALQPSEDSAGLGFLRKCQTALLQRNAHRTVTITLDVDPKRAADTCWRGDS